MVTSEVKDEDRERCVSGQIKSKNKGLRCGIAHSMGEIKGIQGYKNVNDKVRSGPITCEIKA